MTEQDENQPDPQDGELMQPEDPQAQPPPASSADKNAGDTISLLDLMRGTADSDQPAAAEDDTADIPVPLISHPPDVTTTVTISGGGKSTPPPSKPGAPITPETLRPPAKRPLERDPEATEVQPAVAFPGTTRPTPVQEAPTQVNPQQPSASTTRQTPAARPPAPLPQRPVPVEIPPVTRAAAQGRGRDWGGCISRLVLFTLIAGIVLVTMVLAGGAIGYTAVARTLPPPSELSARASAFETVRIYDREGNLLYSQADPNTGNRLYIPLEQMSPDLIRATIATEDKRFYENPGFDVLGIARAVLQAARDQEPIAGTSTITQQLVRAVLLDEDERTERTFRRKVREIILAAEISRTYEKNEILELYLNEVYYGNLAYGVEAAAQTYFQKPASALTVAEASMLAGLPQAPALWDPYTAPDKALGRQGEVLSLMLAEGFITVDEARAAQDAANQFLSTMTPPAVTIEHPHFTLTVLQQAEDLLGAQSIYRGGLRIFTTLDPATQALAESVIAAERGRINAAGANNAAMVVLKPETGEILGLVGSVDYNDEAISGQVNMALAPRQPGSSIKPFVYLSALERGWTPSTLIWDVPTQFADGANSFYEPKNYDDQFHGPLLLREALGNSYNIPAVKALEFVGVCNFINNVQKLGLTDLTDTGCPDSGQPREHGLSLALGGGEVSPLQMAGGFSVLADQGRAMPPYAISRIENSKGDVVFSSTPPAPEVAQVVSQEHAYLLTDILSDDDARQPAFGRNSSVVIPGRQVAAKTGTSGTNRFDVRDAWTIGYTPDVVTAVWVGNTDNSPIGEGQSGLQVAAPIWNSFMSAYLANRPDLSFLRPPSIIERTICNDSGTEPGPDCFERGAGEIRRKSAAAGQQLRLHPEEAR